MIWLLLYVVGFGLFAFLCVIEQQYHKIKGNYNLDTKEDIFYTAFFWPFILIVGIVYGLYHLYILMMNYFAVKIAAKIYQIETFIKKASE